MVEYREIQPHPLLKPYVDCYWQIISTRDGIHPTYDHIFPDGSLDIIFNLGDPMLSETVIDRDSEAQVVGVMRCPIVVGLHGKVDVLGIRFRPGGAAVFFELPLSELSEQQILLRQLWRQQGVNMENRLRATDDPGLRLQILEGELMTRLHHSQHPDLRVMHILQFIREHNGEVSIANLEIETGFSARHLERIFRNCVGIGPKLYCRIVRFRRAYKEILVGQDLTAIAHNRGFSDQSHFCREFKALSGFTPSEFRHLFSDVGFFQDQPYLKR